MKLKPVVSLLLLVLIWFILPHTPLSSQLLPVKPSPTPGNVQGASAEETTVKRVIDGDTIELANGQKVRYIGMDTPEIHHPTKPVQCFGKEAMEENKRLVEGKKVRLEKDVSETDRYGRLLRFVYLEPETSSGSAIFINEKLVRDGYAHVATFPPDVKFVDLFRQAETEAREQQKGLWSKCQ